MNRQLNNKQRELVENNHDLIYSFLYSHNLSLYAIEDWYGIAAIGLCKAAMIYDETKEYEFSMLAYVIMDNEVKIVKQKEFKDSQSELDMDGLMGATDKHSYFDLISDPEGFTYSVRLNDAIKYALQKLNDRDKSIIELIAGCGTTSKRIAEMLKITQSAVHQVYRKFIQSIREYL